MKKYLNNCIKIFFVIFLFVPVLVLADDYECNYKSKDGKTTAGYNPKEIKKTFVSTNDSIKIINYKGKKIDKGTNSNHSSNDYVTDKCYEYMYISQTKVSTSGRYTYSFKLGNNVNELGDTYSGVVLKLNGFDLVDDNTVIKTCSNSISKSLNYNNNLKTDLQIEGNNQILFKFNTYSNNDREFCVIYKNVSNCTPKFQSNNVGSISTNITNTAGEVANFTINSDYIDRFFDKCIGRSSFNVQKNGNTYSLISDYKGNDGKDNADSEQVAEKCEVLPEAIKTYLKQALKLIRWGGLVLMVVLGTLDFVKASAADDQDALKKAGQNFIKRLIAVIILFLLPILVELILFIVGKIGFNFGECYSVSEF